MEKIIVDFTGIDLDEGQEISTLLREAGYMWNGEIPLGLNILSSFGFNMHYNAIRLENKRMRQGSLDLYCNREYDEYLKIPYTELKYYLNNKK